MSLWKTSKVFLHPGRRLMCNDVTPVFEDTAQKHHKRDSSYRQDQIAKTRTPKDQRDGPAKQRKTNNTDDTGQHTHRDRTRDTCSHTPCELPEPGIEKHGYGPVPSLCRG